jgi:hypothetical protein
LTPATAWRLTAPRAANTQHRHRPAYVSEGQRPVGKYPARGRDRRCHQLGPRRRYRPVGTIALCGRVPLCVSAREVSPPRGQSVGYGRVWSRSSLGGRLTLNLEGAGFRWNLIFGSFESLTRVSHVDLHLCDVHRHGSSSGSCRGSTSGSRSTHDAFAHAAMRNSPSAGARGVRVRVPLRHRFDQA